MMPRGHTRPVIVARQSAAFKRDDLVRVPYVHDNGTERDAEVAARVAAAKERVRPRCGECGYLLAWCCCPGGPRGCAAAA